MNKAKNISGKIKLASFLTVFLAVVVVGTIFISFRPGVLDSLSAIYGSVLVSLTNQDRSNLNLSELTVNPVLEQAAQLKADDMAKRGYFSHNTPEGETPWYWFEQAGYKYKYAGENLAVNFTESDQVEQAWEASRGHWLNIINPKYTEIGIATSTGQYKGKEAVFVVQLFGTPK